MAIQPPIYPQIFTHLDCEGTENSADDQTIPQLFSLSPLPEGKKTEERSKSRDQACLGYALQGGGRPQVKWRKFIISRRTVGAVRGE